MRIACLQHANFETPGNIAVWAEARGHSIAIAHLYRGDSLPNIADFDFLIAMGGPISVNDEAEYAWLVPEKELIRECIGANKFVFGVCLGSQLIANALGSRVYRNHVREIGWLPISLLPAASNSALAKLPQQLDVFQWHGETYALPEGCTHLAQSEACRIQAFEHPFALALQFHLEVTEDGVAELIRHCAGDIGASHWEQPKEQMIEGGSKYGQAARRALFDILDAIEARINQSAHKRMNRSELLNHFRQQAATATSLGQLQQGIVKAISENLAHCNWTGFYMLDHADPETLVLGRYIGEPTPHTRIPVSQGICGAAVATGETQIVDDVNSDPRYLSCSILTKSEIVVPIRANGNVVGEIDIDSHSPAAFTIEDRRFLEETAEIVGNYIASK